MSKQLANTPANTLKQLINSESMKKQFALSLPKHLSPERFARIAITAVTRTPKLAECSQESLMKCLLDLSAFGLEPDGRRAHLIPFGGTCTLILDWKGLAELALRSGLIAKLHSDVVCENDQFEYNMGEVTKHVVDWRKPRGEAYAAYAMAQTKTGEKFFAVMSKDEIEGIRKRSRSGNSGPWVTDPWEMMKKSAFRRLSKWLPLSAEFREAVEKDDEDVQLERDITPSKPLTAPTFNLEEAPEVPWPDEAPDTEETK
jgi:recombination protein RecT